MKLIAFLIILSHTIFFVVAADIPQAPPVSNYTYRATVERVKDGDTISNIDLGFDIWLKDTSLRLNRLYVPETFRPKTEQERVDGNKVKDFLIKRLKPGKPITVVTLKDKQEKYGRYLAEVYDESGNINDAILSFMSKNGIKPNVEVK